MPTAVLRITKQNVPLKEARSATPFSVPNPLQQAPSPGFVAKVNRETPEEHGSPRISQSLHNNIGSTVSSLLPLAAQPHPFLTPKTNKVITSTSYSTSTVSSLLPTTQPQSLTPPTNGIFTQVLPNNTSGNTISPLLYTNSHPTIGTRANIPNPGMMYTSVYCSVPPTTDTVTAAAATGHQLNMLAAVPGKHQQQGTPTLPGGYLYAYNPLMPFSLGYAVDTSRFSFTQSPYTQSLSTNHIHAAAVGLSNNAMQALSRRPPPPQYRMDEKNNNQTPPPLAVFENRAESNQVPIPHFLSHAHGKNVNSLQRNVNLETPSFSARSSDAFHHLASATTIVSNDGLISTKGEENRDEKKSFSFPIRQRKRKKNQKPTHKTFEERLRDLIAFKNRFGHCDVPRAYPHDTSLGTWCNNIRLSLRQVRQGKRPHNNLTEYEVNTLTKLGFRWTLKKGRRKALKIIGEVGNGKRKGEVGDGTNEE